jgi:hypothetical protein
MADTIFDTRANPDVTRTQTQTQQAPSYYTNYLSGLSQAGQTALAAPNKVAPLTEMQQQGFAATPGAATAYRPGLTAATATAGTAAAGAAPQIQDFMNPYTTNVVDEMERLQQRNIQRNLMPQLKAGFVSTGGLGSQRYANAMGQTMSDLQSDLTGRQYGALDKGYSDAVTAALNNIQTQNQAARTQGELAGQEQSLGLTGAGALTKAGTEQQLYEQSLIDAPMKTAMNASTLMRGYTVPGTTVTEDKGPLSKEYYAGSPLAQTLGVASTIASGFGSTPLLDSKGNIRYDQLGNMIMQPNNLQKILDSTGISGLASSAGSSISNYIKGIGGSNISGTAAAKDPYTGLPSGSLTGDSVADQESNQYFDLPAGVRPDGKGGYVNEYGYTVNANGAVIDIPSDAGGYDQYMPDVFSPSPGGSAGDYDYTPPIDDYVPGGSAGDQWYYE